MKKFLTLFAVMLCCCARLFAFEPEEGKQYLLQDAVGGLYLVLATGNDSQGGGSNVTAASLAAEGTPFTFTPQDGGFVLSTDDGKYLGSKTAGDVWNADTTTPTVWYVVDAADGHYYINKVNYANKGLGLDNHTQGSGVYTDKPGHAWDIVEYVPAGDHHDVVVNVDGTDYTMLSDGEGNYSVTAIVSVGDHNATVYYDGEQAGALDFTTTSYVFMGETLTETKVYLCFNPETKEITVSGDGVVTDEDGKEYGLYVIGIDGVWNPTKPALKLEKTEDGVYTFKVSVVNSSLFSLSTKLGTSSNDWAGFNEGRLGAPDSDYELWKGESANLTLGEPYSFSIEAGDWEFTVDVNAMTITVVEGVEKPEPKVDQKGLVVMGLNNKWSFDDPSVFVPEREDGIYTFSVTTTDAENYFQISTVLPANPWGWETFNENMLGTENSGEQLWKGSECKLVAGAETFFFISAGEWTFTVDMNAMTLTVVAGAQPPFSAKPEQAYYVKMLDEPAKGIDFVNRGWGSDAKASIVITLSETPTKLYFAQGENGGWTVSDGKGEYMAPYFRSDGSFGWSTTTAAEAYEWTVEGTPEDFIFVREDGKYIGKDEGDYRLFCDKGLDKVVHFCLEEVKTVWNGNYSLPETVESAEELLAFNVEFEEAAEVSVTNMGLIAAVFDESGSPYGLAFLNANEALNLAGNLEVKNGVATVNFLSADEADEEVRSNVMKRIGSFNPAPGKYTVYFAPKSFKVDGRVVEEAITRTYEVTAGGTTGIRQLDINAASDKIFDLSGRRVVAPVKGGLYIVNGKKVLK